MENSQRILDVKSDDIPKETKDFALSIFEFIQKQQEDLKPSRIYVYHHLDGMVFIKCDEHIFTTIRYSSFNESLLQIVSSLAEQWEVKGKMFLYFLKGFYNVLDFSFSYT